MRLVQKISTWSALFVSLATQPCWAYNELFSTGEIVKPGQYRLTGDLQAMTSAGGANAGAMFDAHLQEDFEVRAQVGVGTVDYSLGGFVKWVPIPDVDNQPAVGAQAGLTFARWDGGDEFTLRLNPLVSKKFYFGGSANDAAITPYAGFPIGLRFRNSQVAGVADTTQMTFLMTGGAQLQVERWKNLQFMAEVGVNLDHTFSYVAGAAVFYFDSDTGFKLE